MATFAKLESGSWRVQVRRAGFYRGKTFPTKRQAREWAETIEGQIADVQAKGYHLPKTLTVPGLIDLYCEAHPGAAWGRTKSASLAAWQDWLKDIRLEVLNAVHLRDVIDRRVAEGAGGVTIAADLSFLAACFAWAREARHLDVDPDLVRDARRALRHRRNLRTRSKERDRRPTPTELALLLAHFDARDNAIPMGTLTRFLIASAMRLGEVCRIVAGDVDRSRRTVVIRDRKDPKEKIGNDQTVPLFGDAWTLVLARLEAGVTGRLFPYNPRSVSKTFARACEHLGVEDLHLHDLRHEGISRLFEKGYSVPEVALVSGHKSWANLRRYTNLKPEALHRGPA